MAPVRRRDIVGGLEVRRFPAYSAGQWRVVRDGRQFLPYMFCQPRKRNALALRALLLEIRPDWTDLPTTAEGRLRLPDDQLHKLVELARLADTIHARSAYRQCPGCGMRPGSCVCGCDQPGNGPKLSADQVAWAR
jgi:hypothetical protein